MLNTQSSDHVRELLKVEKFRVGSISASNGLGVKDLLNTPFFTIGGLRSISEASSTRRSDRKSSNEFTTTVWAVLDKYYPYDVGFVPCEKFALDVGFENIEEKAVLPENSVLIGPT
jgi:hypothetical protein